jgi:predicted N-formylglutamate amidohydrolase
MFNTGESVRRTATPGAEADAALLQKSVMIENLAASGRVVIACDHASNHIPAEFGDLGLGGAELSRHIAWDPGALGVSRGLSQRIDAPLVAGGVSRLIIDCNRDPAVFDSITEESDETAIPGNIRLDDDERLRRRRFVYDPFHAALEAVMAARRVSGPVALIGVHTFTPVYRRSSRPWHVGVLYDRDTRLSGRILLALRRQPGLVVGENEPYGPEDRVYHTLDRHAQKRGLPSVMIEIRNDLVATPAGEAEWAERLAEIVAGALPGALAEWPDQLAEQQAPGEA